MRTAIGFISTLMVLAAAARPQRSEPLRLPYEDVGACPFECCTYRHWSVKADTDILGERRDGAAARFRVRAGNEVTGVTGVVVTKRAGRARVVRHAVLAGISVRPGEIVPLLHYVGEGVWRFWLDGAAHEDFIYDAETCRQTPADSVCAVQVEVTPRTTWWVTIRNRDGQEGWTRQVSHFGNIDACGGDSR